MTATSDTPSTASALSEIVIRPAPTPNPASIKFVVNRRLLEMGGHDFANVASAEGSPLAEKLWKLPGVGGVFVGTDFVSITENEDADWGVLGEAVMETLREHLLSGEEHVRVDLVAPQTVFEGDDAAIVEKIQEILDTQIRPAVAYDGGDVVFVAYQEGVVQLRLVGACAGCPSSTATLRQGIETQLRMVIPQIVGIEPV